MAITGNEKLYVTSGGGQVEVSVDEISAFSASAGVKWSDIKEKPVVIAAGGDAAAARSAIGAGTSNLAIGKTATTALAGNTALLALGATATTALAGNTPKLSSAAITAIGKLTSSSTAAEIVAALQAS